MQGLVKVTDAEFTFVAINDITDDLLARRAAEACSRLYMVQGESEPVGET